ncbi:MAG: phospho-sugar mutase [Planctomycetaceae bacterium]
MSQVANNEHFGAAMAAVEQAKAAGRLSASAVENIKRWLTEPQYRVYAPRIVQLVDKQDFKTLETLFWQVIEFGTGGRRGLMGEFGAATINERTIAESAHGLAVYAKRAKPGRELRGVVACDTRNRSTEFSRITATTLAAHGFKVYFFESHRSTPELSFAVRHLNCDVGVMISASHNPPSDNGFKAYWSNGGQVISPHDKGIIDCVYEARDIPTVDFDKAVADGRIEIVGEALDRAYVGAVLGMSLSSERDMPAIFSPLHGVGETSVYRALNEAKFRGVEIFEPHRAPDGNFSAVPDQLPNPERREVFAPMIELAAQTGAELILASDPDADRLGAAVKDRSGRFVHLSGNRIGALLADYILRKRAAAGTLSPECFVIETLVTTRLIAEIAKSHDVRSIDDLPVGFKYIGETIDREGPDKFVFGAEESLGYLAGSYARDKDASIAALYVMELAAELRKKDRTLLDRLDELYVEHGYFVEGQRSETCTGAEGQQQIARLMQELRERPPREFAGIALARVRDYQLHEERALPGNSKVKSLPQAAGNLLFFDSAEGAIRFSIAVRPSGTEPKIKFYFFVHADCPDPDLLEALKDRSDHSLSRLQDAVSNWVRDFVESS